jgi:hypothetical protein
MDGLEIAQRRLHNQLLAGERPVDPVAVVRHFGCVQAQEFAVAKWAVAQRTAPSVDSAAMQRLVDEGAILRTHALRPTWHFVAAADIGWIQSLTAPRVHAFSGYYYRQLGVDDELTARTSKVIVGALRGGNHLTREELGAALAATGVEATGGRLAYVVMRAELDGLIANGAMRGKQHTYALIEERAPDRLELSPDEALAELTRRYFAAHGPATVKDFAWWSSLTVAQTKQGIGLLGAALASETVSGQTFWFIPGDPPGPEPSPTAYALPVYDEYGVAYRDSRWVANLAERRIGDANEMLVTHPLVLDSQLIGYWRAAASPREIVVTLHLAVRLTAAQRRAVEAAFQGYAAFAGVPVTVAWDSTRDS